MSEKLLDVERALRNAEYETAKVVVEMDNIGIRTGRRSALAAVNHLNKAARALTALRSRAKEINDEAE